MSKNIGAYQVIARLDEGARRQGGERYLVEGKGGARFRLCLLEAPGEEDAWPQAQLEASVVAKIEHDALLRVVDTFQDGGRLAVVSETLAGALTLAQLLADEEGVPPAGVWHVGKQLIGALALTHAAADGDDFYTICHGHLGPERVLVDPQGRVGVEGVGLGPLAAAGVLAGPTSYEPPEQAGPGRVTPRGDIFSIAALMWALLEGAEPPEGFDFEGRKELPAAAVELFGRASERSVGKRKVLTMEMEEVLQGLVGDEGRVALGEAVSRARPRATLVGAGPTDGKKTRLSAGVVSDAPAAPAVPTKRSGVDPLASRGRGVIAGPRQGKADGPSEPPRTTSPQIPPMRSREPTMVGSDESAATKRGTGDKPSVPAARKPLPSAPPMDWGAAERSAREGSQITSLAALVDDSDLDWGDEQGWDEDQPTRLNERPNLDGVSEVVDEDSDGATLIATSPPVGVTSLLDEETSEDAHARPSWLDSKGTHKPQSLSALQPPSVLEPVEKRSSKPAAKKPLADLTRAQDGTGAPRPAPSSPGSRPSSPGSRPSSPGSRPSSPGSPPSTPGSKPSSPGSRPSGPGSRPSAPGATDAQPEARPVEPATAEVRPSDHGPAVALDFSDDNEQSLPSRDSARADEARDPTPTPAPRTAPVAGGAKTAVAQEPGGSPWSGGEGEPSRPPEPVEPAPSEPISKVAAVLLSVGTAIVVMVIGVWIQRRDSRVVVPPLPPSAIPTATVSVSAATKVRARPILSASASAAPSSSATATPSGTASASAIPATSASAAASADPSTDDLLFNQGYLIVTFEGPQKDAKVFLFGKDYGKVGDELVVPCERTAFVTVGTAPSKWLSDGQPVKIACRGTTRVTIKPK